MTNAEMSELFSLMALAWPRAEAFRPGTEKYQKTIELWLTCLPDVDYWTARQAMIKLCRESKFPPTIAELREKVEEVHQLVLREIRENWSILRLDLGNRTPQEAYDRLPKESRTRRTIKAMGGPEKLKVKRRMYIAPGYSQECEELDYMTFCSTYLSLLHSNGRPLIREKEARGGD